MNINYKHPEPVQHTTKRFRKLGCALCSAFPGSVSLQVSAITPPRPSPISKDTMATGPTLVVSQPAWVGFPRDLTVGSDRMEICCYFLVTLHLPRFMVISCPPQLFPHPLGEELSKEPSSQSFSMAPFKGNYKNPLLKVFMNGSSYKQMLIMKWAVISMFFEMRKRKSFCELPLDLENTIWLLWTTWWMWKHALLHIPPHDGTLGFMKLYPKGPFCI